MNDGNRQLRRFARRSHTLVALIVLTTVAAADRGNAQPPPNQEMVVIGPGKITRCSDKKDDKIDDCEKLLIDPLAVKRLRELARAPRPWGSTAR